MPVNLAPHYAMDSKFAKQAENNTRRGFRGPREISTDSGISSIDNYFSNDNSTKSRSSPKHLRNKPRNLEMVISGRHKFDVRELEDSLSDESIVPLSLPQLPSVFNASSQPAPLSGLSRTDPTTSSSYRSQSPTDDDATHLGYRKSSMTSLDVESIEEEKAYRDNSVSEKFSRNMMIKECSPSSKTSSPNSSRASWCNAGESMAFKDCSSMSVSSNDSVNNRDNEKSLNLTLREQEYSLFGEEGCGVTNSSCSIGSLTLSNNKYQQQNNDTLGEQKPSPKKLEASPLSIDIGNKFAQITATVGDNMFIDDETSPTDSLVSSTDSDDLLMKKQNKKLNFSKLEKELDDISPILDFSGPLSPGSPTHASNSLSLSDGGRDFLIDDEIADQPALCFAENHGKNKKYSLIFI